jgi:L,D-peptidoglycan transpeptidase YkuD (ErfK/YbiS/YcfS/YnhG family)
MPKKKQHPNQLRPHQRWACHVRRYVYGVIALVPLLFPVKLAATTYPRPPYLQVVTVSVPYASSTYARVESWSWQPTNGAFRRMALFTGARVGASGIGAAREGSSRTPAGNFGLSQPFGVKPNPGGLTVPYLHVDRNDIWTGSTGGVINQHRRCAPGSCPTSYGAFERLSNYPRQYSYAAFIGYNASRPYGTGAVRGKGSAFFLHVKNGSPTAGCVAVGEAQMIALLRWLRPGTNPRITIGVGPAAYATIPHRYI